MAKPFIISALVGALVGALLMQDEDGLVYGAVLGPVILFLIMAAFFAFGLGRGFGRRP